MRNRPSRLLGIVCCGAVFVMTGLHAGCGDDDDDGGGSGASCVETMTKWCDRACACTPGEECSVTTDAEPSGWGLTLTVENRAGCVMLFAEYGCQQPESANIDFAACNTALDSAQCVDTDDSRALLSPAECNGEEETPEPEPDAGDDVSEPDADGDLTEPDAGEDVPDPDVEEVE